MWQEITDVIDDSKELLDLLFGKVTVRKVKQLLCNVGSRLIMAILDFHAKKVNRGCRNRTLLVRDHDSMILNDLEKLLK